MVNEESKAFSTFDPVRLGMRIRQLRIAAGIKNQATLAEKAEIHPSLLSNLERGVMGAKITLQSFDRIADALGVTLADLFMAVDAPLSTGSGELQTRMLSALEDLLVRLGGKLPEVNEGEGKPPWRK